MFYYLMSLVVIIVILIIFNNRAMKLIRDQRDTIDDLNMTIENLPTRQEIEDEIKFTNKHKFKQEYLQLNFKGD
ncbi:MAG: hypothetical protein DRJ61_19435 [Acidobacteria bacterium]|nr:MAG: hypothetical protein DRJ61_19435 [Acidobacteriota bacterium]